MFILRSITKTTFEQPQGTITKTETLETNISLGESYQLITKWTCPDDLERLLDHFWGKKPETEDKNSHRANIYGYVVWNDGKGTHPLYNGKEYYIMTDSGKTFHKIVNLHRY